MTGREQTGFFSGLVQDSGVLSQGGRFLPLQEELGHGDLSRPLPLPVLAGDTAAMTFRGGI